MIAIGSLAQAAIANSEMTGSEIKAAVSGKRIFLKTPFGGEFPLYYRENGKVDGSGKAIGLGRFMKPSDSGRWWVQGDRLCQQWRSWYDGKRFCFTLAEQGGNTLLWTRDDGLSGRARIGK
ncbi:hypothetical protein GR183_18565 [Stappia sp. GBMRC 2046]|uniref:Uncharacterized protein n=1 Tax=Stappia sediminis TaxID=2692190 RepID=A0A7X3LXJ8_9HYPH|nr:hypothetical protein [Stappia sediminis]